MKPIDLGRSIMRRNRVDFERSMVESFSNYASLATWESLWDSVWVSTSNSLWATLSSLGYLEAQDLSPPRKMKLIDLGVRFDAIVVREALIASIISGHNHTLRDLVWRSLRQPLRVLLPRRLGQETSQF